MCHPLKCSAHPHLMMSHIVLPLVCVCVCVEINEFKFYFKCTNKLILIVVAGIRNGI